MSSPLGTSANTCATLNGLKSIDSRRLSARFQDGGHSERVKARERERERKKTMTHSAKDSKRMYRKHHHSHGETTVRTVD